MKGILNGAEIIRMEAISIGALKELEVIHP